MLGPIITSICSNSLSLGIFSYELATVEVICLHENDDIKLNSNHRPISILSSLSEVCNKKCFKCDKSFLAITINDNIFN